MENNVHRLIAGSKQKPKLPTSGGYQLFKTLHILYSVIDITQPRLIVRPTKSDLPKIAGKRNEQWEKENRKKENGKNFNLYY